MSEDTAIVKPGTAISLMAARLSFAAAAQPVHDRSLQNVADGGSLACAPVERAKTVAEEGWH